jgi:thiamine pyrophosphate-dependent acetolactate synthase large subunit-like protein
MATKGKPKPRITLERRKVVSRILEGRGDALLITGIGNASQDCAAAGDDVNNFYLFGIMGGAAGVGLGLALAQPGRRVLVITGDGEMLAGIGTLATIGIQKPANLAIVVIDNQAYAATGGQQTHTGQGVDLAGIAKASAIPATQMVWDARGLEAILPAIHKRPGPFFAVVKVHARPTPRVPVPNDGTYMQHRFRGALLGARAFE